MQILNQNRQDLICAEQIRNGKNQSVIQKTKLGWIIAAPYIAKHQQATEEYCGFSNASHFQVQLQRFWKIEDIH